eukprot:14387077-Alexandrium_andersonii.AAC.1
MARASLTEGAPCWHWSKLTTSMPGRMRGEPNALEHDVGAKADLLVLRVREPVLRQAAQVVEAPEGARPWRPRARPRE